MMTVEQIKAERATATARLAEVAEELREDPRSEGAKRERRALRKVLKSLDECESIVIELASVRAALAMLA